MKICLINNLYKPYMRGGAERVVESIEGSLKQKGHDVFIISTAPVEKEKDENIYYLKSLFHNLDKIPFVLRFFWHIWDSFNFVNYFKIKKILEREKPDIVMTHALKGISFLIPRLLRKLKIKHIHTLHDIQILHPSGLMFYKKENIINTLQAKIYQIFNKFLFASPNLIISPSHWLLDLHKSKGFFKNSKSEVLPNPSHASFKEKRKKNSKENSNFTFLYVGLAEKHKGILLLVKAFIKSLDLEKNLELSIICSGSQEKEIKKITKKFKQIKILGKRTIEEVGDAMQKADYLVVPSVCYENSPTVIYEAIEIGLPIIASRIGGIPELIDKYGGFLVEPDNLDDLLEKMEFVINNHRELKKIIKSEKEFSSRDYVKEIIELVS